MKQFTKVCFATVIDSLRIRSIRSIMLHAYERVLCGWNCRVRNDVNPQRMHNTNSSGANHTVLSIFQRLICALNSTNLKMSFKSKLKRKRESANYTFVVVYILISTGSSVVCRANHAFIQQQRAWHANTNDIDDIDSISSTNNIQSRDVSFSCIRQTQKLKFAYKHMLSADKYDNICVECCTFYSIFSNILHFVGNFEGMHVRVCVCVY